MKLMATQKNLIVIGGVAITILLLVWIIGPGRIRNIFDSKKAEQILQLKEKVRQDSLKIVSLQYHLSKQKDSINLYVKLYEQEKVNYKIITKYYEKKIQDVHGLPAKEAIDYFNQETDCEDTGDTSVITRLSNIMCANVKFVEREMFLMQRDTLQTMNKTLEGQVGLFKNITVTQDEIIKTLKTSTDDLLKIITTQEDIVAQMQKEKEKEKKKLKRTKTFAIITGSAAIVLGAVLILQ